MSNSKIKAVLTVETYKTDFKSLIFNLSCPPGANLPCYSSDFLNEVLKAYLKSYSIKTVKRLIKQNERTWEIKGYKISWDEEFAYSLISK